MLKEPLSREQVEHICKHGVEDGHYFTRVGAAQSILATDAALRAQLAAMTAERGVWEQAAQFWETVDAGEMAKQYPTEQYPKWRDIFAAWCRDQSTERPPAIDIKRFERAPCYLCGYGGCGYYQPDTHPCAKYYHEAVEERPPV